MKNLENNIEKILFSEYDIEKIVADLAESINADFKNQEIILVGLLKGSVVFMSDLLRKITLPCEIDFMAASSYGSGTTSNGDVKIIKDLTIDIKDKNVIIVEDIIDSGNTLSRVLNILKKKNPKNLRLCSFLSKPDRREVNDIRIDYLGTEIPDEFVVGYGLDFDEKYGQYGDKKYERCINDIGIETFRQLIPWSDDELIEAYACSRAI